MTMKKAIIYTRFSPRRNAEECHSCETQAAFCEQYASQHDMRVVATYHDPDAHGKDEYREQLWDAIKALGRDYVLLVYKRDRLARNLYLACQIERAVKARNATIEAVSGDIQGDGHEQTLMRQIVAAMAEYERKLIAERTRSAMRKHQADGRLMSRHPPYGWSRDPADPKRLIPNKVEQEAVARIKLLRDADLSCGKITKKMNEEMPKAARAGKWNTKSVWKIAKRD